MSLYCLKNGSKRQKTTLPQTKMKVINKIKKKYDLAFICFEDILQNNIEKLKKSATKYLQLDLFYSYKTNWLPGICKIIHKNGVGAEVVSGFELWLARLLGVPNEKIIFNGPCKTTEELKEFLNPSIGCLNIDSLSEFTRLLNIWKGNTQITLGIRITPEKIKDMHMFGIISSDYNTIDKIVETSMKNNFNLKLLHTHIAHYLNYKEICIYGCEELIKVLSYLYQRYNILIKNIDLGGGLNPALLGKDRNCFSTCEDFFATVAKTFEKLLSKYEMPSFTPNFILESGRFIVNNTFMLLTTIHALKRIDGQEVGVLDAGTNILGTPHEDIIPIFKTSSNEIISYRLIGPLCFPGDIVAISVKLPPLTIGDKLLILDCGAYSLSNSWQFIKTRPPVILVTNNDEIKIIRKKERYRDMISLDRY